MFNKLYIDHFPHSRMCISECKNGHFEEIRAWLQILEWGSNSTIFYLTFDTHDNPGAVFIWKWEIFSHISLLVKAHFQKFYIIFYDRLIIGLALKNSQSCILSRYMSLRQSFMFFSFLPSLCKYDFMIKALFQKF